MKHIGTFYFLFFKLELKNRNRKRNLIIVNLPPMTPYVIMSISIEVEKVARKNPTDETIAPDLQTARQLNLFTIAEANGPGIIIFKKIISFLLN